MAAADLLMRPDRIKGEEAAKQKDKVSLLLFLIALCLFSGLNQILDPRFLL